MTELPSLLGIKAFVLTSQYQSFTKVAEAMYLTQGAVSRQIKQLEMLLGVQLFVREHHLVRLTKEGMRVLPYFRQALETVHEGISALHCGGVDATHLWLNIAPTFSTRWLVPRLPDFFAKNPNVNLTVTTDYDPNGSYHSRADCQVRFGTEPLRSAHSQLLFSEESVLVGLPHLKPLAADLPRLLCTSTLLHILDGYGRLELWEHWVLKAGIHAAVDPSEGLSFSTMDQVINAVLSGIGIALLDRNMILRELEEGKLAQLCEVTSTGPHGYWLDSRVGHEKAAVLRLFTDWLTEQAVKNS